MTETPDDSTAAWDADLYDSGHSFVYEYGADLVDLLDPEPGERVLDLGCGTGHLTNELGERGAEAVGLDRSVEMLAEARATYPNCEFVRGDARSVGFDETFDSVLSNAVLHWIPDADQDEILASVADALRPGGRFVAELGGAGNVESIVDAVRDEITERGYDVENPWYFPSVGEYAPRIEDHGFEVRHARLFERPTELDDGDDGLAAWLRMFGEELFAPLSESERDEVVTAVEARLRDDLFRDGSWVADYRRLRFVAVKEEP